MFISSRYQCIIAQFNSAVSIYCIDIVLLTLLRWVSKYILDIVWTERALINWVRYQLESNTAARVESSNESSRFVAWSHCYLLLLYSMVSAVCCLCSSKVDTIENIGNGCVWARLGFMKIRVWKLFYWQWKVWEHRVRLLTALLQIWAEERVKLWPSCRLYWDHYTSGTSTPIIATLLNPARTNIFTRGWENIRISQKNIWCWSIVWKYLLATAAAAALSVMDETDDRSRVKTLLH